MTNIQLKAIGVIQSSLKTTQDSQSPPQLAILKIHPAYCLALEGINKLSKISVLYWLHEADREVLRVYPGGDRSKEMIGVFCNRSPLRPNPIAVSLVDIVEVGVDHIRVSGLDAIDGSPIIDIKAP